MKLFKFSLFILLLFGVTIIDAQKTPPKPYGTIPSERHGEAWISAEVDVSIRPGWFYHTKEDSRVKSLKRLKEIYFKSVGNGACWNLNVPPDRTGQINAHDIKSLDSLQDYLTKSFSINLLQGARVEASETRRNLKKYAASNVLSNNKNLYWAVNDNSTTASLTFQLKARSTFNCMEIKEFVSLGQRIRSFTIEVENNGKWNQVFKGSTVGSKKLAKFNDVTLDKDGIRRGAYFSLIDWSYPDYPGFLKDSSRYKVTDAQRSVFAMAWAFIIFSPEPQYKIS